MKGYLITNNATVWKLCHSRYAKSKKSREFLGQICFMVFFLLLCAGAIIVPLKERDVYFSVPFFVGTVVLTILSYWTINCFRTAILRWKRCVFIDGALQTINLYETYAPLVSVGLVELSLTQTFPFQRLLVKMGSADYVLLDERYDWHNEAEWRAIGSSLATFLGVSFESKFEDVTRLI